MTQKVLVTGASGFVGRALVSRLLASPGLVVSAAVRRPVAGLPDAVRTVQVDDLTAQTVWQPALAGIDVVVHAAARAHVLHDTISNPLAEFRKTNVEGTLNLARQAMAAGVKRFVFISSIGVNGATTTAEAFDELSPAAPHADYALSKHEAEQGLLALSREGGMEVVIIRPPLVYAGHAPGNFARLLKLVASGLPMPFALVRNRRSLVALDNLVDFIACCVWHPAAANQVFLVSDGEDVSTADIVRQLAAGMGRKSWLAPVPPVLMAWAARLVGKRALYTQLCGSLAVDSGKARRLLGWKPPVSATAGLRQAGQDYLKRAFQPA